MVEIRHEDEPKELSRYRRQNPGGNWGDAAFKQVRAKVRAALNAEQEGLCAYCECPLDSKEGHVDHIKPRTSHPKLAFAYENLAHSCDGPGHCGRPKGDRILPVEPRYGCNRFFTLLALDGQLMPAPDLTDVEKKQASETLDVLGLNTPALSWQRRGFARALVALPDPVDRAKFMASSPFRWSLQGL